MKNILIADDLEVNRYAAKQACPHATIVSSAEEAIDIIKSKKHFDLVLTDIIMETPYAGFEVVRATMQHGNLVYALSNAGRDHGMDYVSLNPYGFDNFSALRQKYDITTGKQNPKTWELALESIAQNPAGKAYKHSIAGMQARVSNWLLDKHICVAMYGFETSRSMNNEQRMQLKKWLEE